MEIVDLTHTMMPEMPVFPGDPAPCVDSVASVGGEGFAASVFSLGSHCGTHMDAPAHVREGASTLDDLSADSFVGSAVVVNCRDVAASATVGMDCITRHGQAALEAARQADFLLFDFGWGDFWSTPAYFEGYPCIGMDVVRFAAETGKKAVGFDSPSADPLDDASLTRHNALLGEGVMIIENLKCLDRLHASGELGVAGPFRFAALPLKVRGSDGAPVRAIAVLED